MIIKKNLEENNLQIILAGRLDTNTAPELEKEVESLEGVENVILDFKDLEYISSAGLRTLLTLQKKMNKAGSMIIKNASENVKEIFEITGFREILTIE